MHAEKRRIAQLRLMRLVFSVGRLKPARSGRRKALSGKRWSEREKKIDSANSGPGVAESGMKGSRSKIPAPLQEVGVNIGVASTVEKPHIEAVTAAAGSEVSPRRGMDMEGKRILVGVAMAAEGVSTEDEEEIEPEANEAAAEDVVVEAGVFTKAGDEAENIQITPYPRPPSPSHAIHQQKQKQTSHHSHIP